MINDLIGFFSDLLGVGSTAVATGSATAGEVANLVTGSLGVDNLFPAA